MKRGKMFRLLLVVGVLFSQTVPVANGVYADVLEEGEVAAVMSEEPESVTEAAEEPTGDLVIEAELPEVPVVPEVPTEPEQPDTDDPEPVANEPVVEVVQPEETVAAETTAVVEEPEPEPDLLRAPRAVGLPIDGTSFPDVNFQNFVNGFDTDGDGSLSDAELQAVTDMSIPSAVADITGIKLFVNLSTLSVYSTQVASIDVSGMTQLTTVNYSGNPNLKTLDFRNCPSLSVGWHSASQETVYISAGMTNYIGCDAVREHTGNVVIDLSGYYTDQSDGSKTVDLNTVISARLLSVFSQKDQPNFDKATGILTIPAGEGMSQFEAGRDSSGQPTMWTFYTNINKVDDVVKFESNGGSIVGAKTIAKNTPVPEPTVPTKDGFAFIGWYADEALTIAWDFTTPISTNMTLYAKWGDVVISHPLEVYQVTFESNGGSAVASQTVPVDTPAAKPTDPTKDGFVFGGWFVDKDLTIAWDFTANVTGNMTLYAKWTAVTPKPAEPVKPVETTKKTVPETGGAVLPKTGEETSAANLMGWVLIVLTGCLFWFNTKKVWEHSK